VETNNKNENTNTNNNTNKNINETTQNIKQEIKSPPASAIAPSIGASYSQDLCTTGVSGAFQGQIFGLAGGMSINDLNCERIKLSKTVYDMGMKVAAVSLMCQDERVFKAMEMAGTPCPYQGAIGQEAAAQWVANPTERPDYSEYQAKLDRIEEEKQEAILQEIKLQKSLKSDWIRACKKTLHTSGKSSRTGRNLKGIKKSGSTCKREWKLLETSSTN